MGQRNPPEGDARPDPVLEHLHSVRRGIDSVNESVRDVKEQLTALAHAERRDRRAFQLDFSGTVTATTDSTDPDVVTREIPFDGYISAIYVDIPSSGDNEVGVSLGRNNGESLFPRNRESDYLHGDGLSEWFVTRATVVEDEELDAAYVNSDANNDYEPVVLVTVEERLEGDPSGVLTDDEE